MHIYFMHTNTHTYKLLDFSVMDIKFRYQRNMLLKRIVQKTDSNFGDIIATTSTVQKMPAMN